MVAYERKTGPGMAYILCDICGRKIRQKDAILITDPYNLYYQALVCKYDVDKENPQNRPFIIRELQVQNPKLLRSERPDVNVPGNTSRAPGAPQNLIAKMNSLTNQIALQWQGPLDIGSSPILGYIITRAIPQDNAFFTIANTTTSNGDGASTYYLDIESDPTINSAYIVYAVNSAGQGTASDIAYFPRQIDVPIAPRLYITASQNNYTITTSDGRYLTTSS